MSTSPSAVTRLAALVVLAGTVAWGRAGQAQTSAAGFAVDHFDPAERGSDWFTLESLRPQGRSALGLTLDWAHRPLVLYDDGGNEVAAIVREQLVAHLGGAFVWRDRLRFGASIPLALLQTGSPSTLAGTSYAPPEGAALGDLRLGVDGRIFGEAAGPLRSAVGLQLYLPTGSRAAYTGDGQVRARARALLAFDEALWTGAAQLAFHFRPRQDEASLGTQLQAGLAVGARVLEGKLVVGPELSVSRTLGGASSGGSKTPIELLLGAHYALSGGWQLGAGVGPGLSRGPGAPAVRILASVDWSGPAAPADGDRDGIADRDDACPAVAGLRSADPRTNGCPPPRPVAPPPPDRDHDGVLDGDDACPDQAGVPSPDPKLNGCPPPPPDRDKDGVTDAEDACPDLAGVATTSPKTNGCPPDRDADGVLDQEDACPDQPGPRDSEPRKNGCPVAVVDAGQIKIREQIKFKSGKAKILPESQPILESVAQILKAHPEITRVSVEGHTDAAGGPLLNTVLSAARARAVVQALVSQGVSARRFTSVGHGPRQPVDSNNTPEGRANNRRVEFHIVAPGNKEATP